jgi:hypothetical protein
VKEGQNPVDAIETAAAERHLRIEASRIGYFTRSRVLQVKRGKTSSRALAKI